MSRSENTNRRDDSTKLKSKEDNSKDLKVGSSTNVQQFDQQNSIDLRPRMNLLPVGNPSHLDETQHAFNKYLKIEAEHRQNESLDL